MKEKKITYFEYARKSTEEDTRQVLSIEGQLKDNREKTIIRHNLSVIKTFTDSKSASVPFNRPGYTEMIKRIKKGEAEGIVVWNVDRLLRNPLEEGEFKWLLQTGVIKSIWTPSREYRSEDNGLLFSIEVSMATQYSVDLAIKVKRGNKQKWEMGQPLGVARLGYLNTKFQEHGTNYLLEDNERFPILRKGFDFLLEGVYTVPQILAKLHELGLTSRATKRFKGGLIPLSTLYRIFSDIFYAGYFYRNGQMYKGSYKPMITLEEFDQIQALLGRKGKPKPHKHQFAFTGFIRCGSCGCAITATKVLKKIKKTGEYKTYVFYHCTKRKGRENCSFKHYLREEQLTSMMREEIAQIDFKPVFREWIIGTVKENQNAEWVKRDEAIRSTIQYQNKLNQELDRLLDMRIANEISEKTYLSKKTEREGLLMRVEEKRNRLEMHKDDGTKQLNEIVEFAENLLQRFNTGDAYMQKSICTRIGSNWILSGNKLIVTKREWFYSLESVKKHYQQKTDTSQPINTFEEYKKTASFKGSIPIVRRLRDDVLTEHKKGFSEE